MMFKKFFGIIACFLLINNSSAQQLNIHVRFEDELLRNQINQFNECLEQSNLLTRYQITPFINNFPLHITLYLASFEEQQRTNLFKKVKSIAQQTPNFLITSSIVYLTQGNYLMLDIDFKTEYNQHPMLQKLSDEAVLRLSNERDFSAPIPPWAASIPIKKKAFAQYGSPNVFFEYSPHFTLFAKVFNDPELEKQFHSDIDLALQHCTISPQTIKAKSIGISEVDDFGQLTNQLAEFVLG